MTAIIAAHRHGDKTDYYQARDLISVSLARWEHSYGLLHCNRLWAKQAGAQVIP